jgi:hypothetical protein
MTCEEFKALDRPDLLSLPLQALWYDAQGEWEPAHDLAQAAASPEGDWVHAYLHRKEGDPGNARYWYAQAGRPVFTGALDDEWAAIAVELLACQAR